MKKIFLLSIISVIVFSGCTIVQPGEVGVKNRLGKLNQTPNMGGIMLINPFITKVIKLPTRTVNRELSINLPSKEGLTINSDISILYYLEPEMAPFIIQKVGTTHREVDQVITSVFRSAAADVCAKFYAKDMHSGKRGEIEALIADRMNEVLSPKGFMIEAVLMKSISLPGELSRAIEQKLSAEQQAERMDFELITEKKEAERKQIEATGTRDAQLILSDGLTPEILQLRQIEAMRDLTKSSNSKVIVTDGRTPFLLDGK